MLPFCPNCGTLLAVEEGSNCLRFGCTTCPFIRPITSKVSSRVYPKLKDLDEVLGGPDAWKSAPTCN
uniref:DNA-directed RNA polymerase M/15kDa subunit domain-containing protein n=1 Tax=Plectus sambesii TaxID=2011161 RepID=A0A914WPI8_9BILA